VNVLGMSNSPLSQDMKVKAEWVAFAESYRLGEVTAAIQHRVLDHAGLPSTAPP
jgi:hypothetical protein